MRIATVLRSGGEYKPEHVERLAAQVCKWAPEAEFICLSDLDVGGRIPLKHGWPGWWSKLELMRSDVVGDGLLYFDLDTTIRGSLDDILAVGSHTILSDFYWPHKIQSSMMFITPEAAASAWEAFVADPERHMRECVTRERWGDQGFLEGMWGRAVSRWQDVLPGQVCSWKVDCRHAENRKERGVGLVPESARVIIWHGSPRPWEVGF